MKIKLSKFDGIYTNTDQNDLSFEKVQFSCNLSHENGYLVFNDYKLEEDTLPTLEDRWEWETGIYCTLAEDPLDKTGSSETFDVLVLIAKSGNISFERRVWLREGSTWQELSAEADIGSTFITLSRDALTTTIDGSAFFRPDNGYLRLYLPHDTFWIGRIKRDAWIPDGTFLDHDCSFMTYGGQWYIDRLVDKFDETNLFVNVNGTPTIEIPSGINNNDITCANDRRLGIRYTTELREEQTEYIEQEEINWTSVYVDEPTFKGWKYTATRASDGTVIMPPYVGGPDQLYWYFYQDSADPAVMGIHPVYHDVLTTLGADPMGRVNIDPFMWAGSKIVYTIGHSVFDAQTWYYAPGNQISTAGFEALNDNLYIIVTAVLDERDEIPIDFRKEAIPFTGGGVSYALRVDNLWLPIDINKRLTRLRFYIKTVGNTDFELYKEIDMLDQKVNPYSSFYLYGAQATGIYLAQNIAYLFDETRPQDYRIISGFRDVVTINEITLALKQDSRAHLYHSIVGGGTLQTNMILTANKLLIPHSSNIIAVTDINNNAGIITDQKVFMCTIGESQGQLIFEIQDSIEHGISDFLDVIQTQNSIIMHTRNGIFLTNGYEVKLLSEPINNIVKENHTSYNIQYNPYKHLLYYTDTGRTYYQYRFDYGKWEAFRVLASHSGLQKVLIDLNGEASFLFETLLYKASSSGDSLTEAYLITNDSDLGEASVDKLVNFFDIDYSGSLEIKVYLDSTLVQTFTSESSSLRRTQQIFMPLIDRKPFQKIYLEITFLTITSRLYKLEIDFSTIKRRFHDYD